ncbi:MAG: HNH endonuclease, partial [Polyangiales bacterium]
RCGERGFLQIHHHDTPFARGGLHTVDNLRLVCRSHNTLYAERDFGQGFIRSTVQHARLRKLSVIPAAQSVTAAAPSNSVRNSATRDPSPAAEAEPQ